MKVQPREPGGFAPELNELLVRRAQRIRQKAAEVDTLRAAVPLKMVTPVPLSPPHVIGILRFQGQIVTALSLASLLGGRGWREDPAVLLVVDPGFGRLVAVDCERIPKPSGLPHAQVAEARARSSGPTYEITLAGARQVSLLDLLRLMDRRQGQEKR